MTDTTHVPRTTSSSVKWRCVEGCVGESFAQTNSPTGWGEVPAGKAELEISDLLKGTWSADASGFVLRFPSRDFTVRACLQIAFFRKCFELREIRATASEIALDFGNAVADRRYTF